jgi:hypothetical protein
MTETFEVPFTQIVESIRAKDAPTDEVITGLSGPADMLYYTFDEYAGQPDVDMPTAAELAGLIESWDLSNRELADALDELRRAGLI